MSPQANSDSLRPRRRASQTHFFRYQQAANPLRAEEKDLKKALIASLQDGSKKKKGGITVQDVLNQFNKNHNSNNHLNESKALKQQYATNTNKKLTINNDNEQKPTRKQRNSTISNSTNNNINNGIIKRPAKKKVTNTAIPTKAKRCTNNNQPQKRITSSKSLCRKKHSNISNATNTSMNTDISTTTTTATTNLSKTSNKSNYSASKRFSALRKFATNQPRPASKTSPLENCTGSVTHYKGTNGLQSEYFPKTYKPETEDFLTFLCVRLPPPMFSDFEYSTLAAAITAHAKGDYFNLSNRLLTKNINNNNINNNVIDNDTMDLKLSKRIIESNSDARQTRQSARLNCQRKISESDSAGSLNCDDNSTSVEEEPKHSLALHELDDDDLSSLDEVANEVAQETPDLAVDKYLIKGLMTSEFAGAFADEETLFDLVDNSDNEK